MFEPYRTNGTTFKFLPFIAQDTVRTKGHCITFMKEYEEKSIEELRFEDYVLDRKGPQSIFDRQLRSLNGIFNSQMKVLNGTTVKFESFLGQDTMMKNNIQTTVYQCIIVMKEYEAKSIEELRYEDYLENRKGNIKSSIFNRWKIHESLYKKEAQKGSIFWEQAVAIFDDDDDL